MQKIGIIRVAPRRHGRLAVWLRRFLLRVKEREQMLLFKFKKTEQERELDKRAELNITLRMAGVKRPEYHERQLARKDEDARERLVERIRKLFEPLIEKPRGGVCDGVT